VGVKDRFHLDGVDVFPAPDDHILHPIHDIDVAFVVDPGYVSRMQPAIKKKGSNLSFR
jgi:hypothetical protein